MQISKKVHDSLSKFSVINDVEVTIRNKNTVVLKAINTTFAINIPGKFVVIKGSSANLVYAIHKNLKVSYCHWSKSFIFIKFEDTLTIDMFIAILESLFTVVLMFYGIMFEKFFRYKEALLSRKYDDKHVKVCVFSTVCLLYIREGNKKIVYEVTDANSVKLLKNHRTAYSGIDRILNDLPNKAKIYI